MAWKVEKIGQVLKEYSAPVVWKFTSQQIQDPVKVAQYLKEKSWGGSRKEQLTALCWGPGYTLSDTAGYQPAPQEEKEEEENRPTATMATQTAAAPEEHPMLGAVAPEQNTSKTKLVSLVRDEEEAEFSEEEEEAEPEIISKSQRKLQEIRRHFLYGCWCAGADGNTLLDSSEAKQLGSLSWDVVIDRGIGRKTGIHSLWMRLMSGMREAHTVDELLV